MAKHDQAFEDSVQRHRIAIGLLSSIKRNTEPDIAFDIAADGFANYMIDYYSKVLANTEPGTQERFDRFREHYETYARKSAYIRILESTPSTLKVNYNRCPFAEIMEEHGLSELTHAFCLSDEAFTRKLLPGVGFHRMHLIAKGDKCCDHTWTKNNK